MTCSCNYILIIQKAKGAEMDFTLNSVFIAMSTCTLCLVCHVHMKMPNTLTAFFFHQCSSVHGYMHVHVINILFLQILNVSQLLVYLHVINKFRSSFKVFYVVARQYIYLIAQILLPRNNLLIHSACYPA